MSLDFEKRTYIDGETVITADNLNGIQDAVLELDAEKYEKPSGGIPSSDLNSSAQAMLLPSGGTAGQVLSKKSSSNYDVEWANGGSGGTSDYADLTNKPQINSHTLTGNQSAADLGLGTYSKPSGGIPDTDLSSAVQASLAKADTALQTAPVISVNNKTGAVSLSASDVGAYSIPSGGIPDTDLSSSVQASLGKADTALQTAPVSSVDGKTGAVTVLPSGGSSGQVLKKNSSTDYDVFWGNESGGGGGGGTSDYADLTNKPQINSVTLSGNLSAADLSLGTYSKPSGGIPDTDLSSSVQTSLGLADTAYQKPSGGIPSTDLASAVQTSIGLADTALQASGDGSNVTAAFSAASSRTNISTGEKLSVIFGKIAKWFSDLGTAAFRAATSSVTQSSTDLIESGAVYTGLAGKADSDLGISGASANQYVKISSVNVSGAPTAFTYGTFSADGNPLYYAICTTAADEGIKYITVSELSALSDGVCIRVLFTNAHSLNISPTLTVSGSGGTGLGSDITIYSRFGTEIGGHTWEAGTVIDFVYRTSSSIPPLPGFVVISDPTSAKLASPAFTGVPTAPTASSGTNTTQIATTAFVQTALTGKADSDLGVSGASANQFVKISSVDGSGKPTAFGSGTVAEIDLGISGASASDMIKVSTVDGNGKPTAWTKAVSGTDYQTPVKLATVTLLYNGWGGSGPWTQTAVMKDANDQTITPTANTKVDVQPDDTALAQLIAAGVQALFISNTSGTLTAYAIGAQPAHSSSSDNITLQVTYYETTT